MTDPDAPAGHPGTDQDEMSSRYVIGRLLGRGGMGEVRIANDQRLLRDVAVKTLIAADGDSEARFLREAQITGRLTHSNIPPIHDLGVGPTGLFFTMRALPGRDLWQIVEQEGRLEVGAGLQLFSKVCDAVGYAHSRGVLHRDLKPANIVVGEHGEVYVIDWGLAKSFDRSDDAVPSIPTDPRHRELTQAGEVLGTPTYMSPEHAAGAELDPRSDVYALGAILYVILTGQRPFKGRGYLILVAVMKGEFDRPRKHVPGIPWEVEAIILKAMALDREHRYPDVGSMLADIAAFQDGRMVPGIAYGPVRRLRRTVARYGAAAAGVSLLVGGLAAFATVALVLYAVTLVMARDRALDAERVAESRALEQQVALAQLRARSGMPAVARTDLDDAMERSAALGLDSRPARFAAAHLDMAFPPPEIVANGEGTWMIDDAGERVAWLVDHELAVHDLLTGDLLRRTSVPGTGELRLDRDRQGALHLLELDGTHLRGMDATTGKRQWEVEVDTNALARIQLSQNGARMSVNEGSETRFYTVPEGVAIGPAHDGKVSAISVDGRRAALQIREGGPHRQIELVRVVDVDSGETLGELRGAARWAFSDDLATAVRSGGSALEAVGLDGAIQWTAGAGLSPPTAAQGDQVAYMSDVGALEVRQILTGERTASRSLGWSPHATTADLDVRGGWVSTRQSDTFRAWSLAELPASWRAHGGALLSVDISPDGQLAASTGWEGDLVIWDWRSRRQLLRYRISDRGVRSVCFASDGRQVATVDREGQLRIVNLVDGTLGPRLDAGRGIAMDVRWQSPADLVVLYEDGALVPWDLTRGAPGMPLQGDLVTGWALSQEGSLLAVSGRDEGDPVGELWDLSAGARLARTSEVDAAYGVAVSPDGKVWVVGVSDGSLVWIEDGVESRFTPSVQRGPAMSLDFSPDGTLLAIGSFDGRVVLVDRTTRAELHTLEVFSSAVQRLAFDPTGRHLLIAGSEPGMLVEFDLDRAARAEASQLVLRFGEDVTAPDWEAAAERAELRGDWERSARALSAAVARGVAIEPVRLARSRAGNGDVKGALQALEGVRADDGTAASWRRALLVLQEDGAAE